MLVSALLAGLVMGSAPATPPPRPPPAFRGTSDVARPLDQRLRQAEDPSAVLETHPDAWCPVGPDFQRWLEERSRLGGLRTPSGAPAPAALGGAPAGLDPARSLRPTGQAVNVVLDPSGVVVMEDDGTLQRYDRRIDVAGRSFELLPSGSDWSVASVPFTYDDVPGTQVITDQRGYAEAPVDLAGIVFPFGGAPRSRLWITSTMAIAFEDPNPPAPSQLRLSDSLQDRMPRIGVLQSGTSIYGWNAFVREDADRVVVTWRVVDGGWLDLDVQAVLFTDGRILLSYRSVTGVLHGSIVVVDGDQDWWGDRAAMGSVNDPGGEVGIPAPDGPAIDVMELRAYQVAGSEMIDIELVTEQPLPPATDGTLQYAFEFRDEPGGPVFSTLWGEWQDGRWNWQYMPIELDGNIMRFRVTRGDMPLADDDFEVVAWTAQNWSFPEAVGAVFTLPTTPATPLMADMTTAPFFRRGPLIEAFTLPELDVGRVYEQFNRRFASPRIDALAIYQNYYTDIVFYAGAYSTVGNAGADGIGVGNSVDPESPALLHMNTIRYGWNWSDDGKVTVLNHEFGHHWLYFLSIMEGGTVGKPLGDGHPAGWVHAPAAAPVYNMYDASCMGGSTWTDNADGTFTAAPGFASRGYSWHELYLMGLADFSEVSDWYYLRDSVPGLPGEYWPPDGITVTATRVDVTAQQVVDALGPRVPDRAASRTDFLVPMVLVVRPGEWVQEDVDEVARTCQIWREKFNVSTVGRGTVTCDRVGFRPPNAVITIPDRAAVVPYGGTLSFSGVGEDPDGDDVLLEWDFGGLAPPAFGPGPHDVTFPLEGPFVITLRAYDETGLEDPTPAEISVYASCHAPRQTVRGLKVARDRANDELVFRWTPLSPDPDEYVLFEGTGPAAGLMTLLGSGRQGLRASLPPGNRFYLVAARELPDCLGPLTP